MLGVKLVRKKMIRTTDAKEVGVGNTAEETCRCPDRMKMVLSRPGDGNPQIALRKKWRDYASFYREIRLFSVKNGGEGGIRTLVTLSSNHAFQACAFNLSLIHISEPTRPY